MGPKKKGKKGGKKKEEKPPRPTKSQYVEKIAERNAVLAQGRRKIAEIEDVYLATEKRYEQTQEDMADIIKYLQHEIEENEEEIAAFDEKIFACQEEIRKNDTYYQSIFSKMESEYEEKNMALKHQIQLTSAKLFASEEIKKQKDEYLKKKEEICRRIEEMEARHQKEIYEAQKLAIIRQDTMQKDMEMNVTTLATDFRQATDIAIGETTNKLIRDNIYLGNTLTCMQEIIEDARNLFQKVHEIEKQYRHNAELLDEEHYLIHLKHTHQLNEIETLLKSQEELTERIILSQSLIKDNRRLQRQIAEKECILREKTDELNYHLKDLRQNEEIYNSVKNNFSAIRRIVVKFEFSLFEAAKRVKEGIDVENLMRLETDDDLPMELDKEEQEESLKEHKYKTRELAIEEAIGKLTGTTHTDAEIQLMAPSSDSYLANFHENPSGELPGVRSNVLTRKGMR